jgi:hypothetical protein
MPQGNYTGPAGEFRLGGQKLVNKLSRPVCVENRSVGEMAPIRGDWGTLLQGDQYFALSVFFLLIAKGFPDFAQCEATVDDWVQLSCLH